jgi:L-alanine-DL-glutamate epimerase-like enolase superfamily enzyme
MTQFPALRIQEIRLFVFREACRKPVRTAFGAMKDRPALLVRLRDSEGMHGWGEVWCNFPACGAEHRAKLLETVVAPLLLDNSFSRPEDAWHILRDRTRLLALQSGEPGPLAQVLAGVDIAMWDLAARRLGKPLYQCLADGMEVPSPALPVYASGINPDVVVPYIVASRDKGFRAFKFKAGFTESVDRNNFLEALGGIQPDERIAIDTNQNWNLSQALKMIRIMQDIAGDCRHVIEWLEEPLAADEPLSFWQNLREAGAPTLAGGENLLGERAFDEAVHHSALGIIQPDLCKWGGFTGCRPVALTIREAGKRYCPHYLGGGIGLLASAHLLASVGGDGLLEVDVNENPLRESLAQPYPALVNGCFTLDSAPGLGVEPDFSPGAPQPLIERCIA